MSFFAKKNEEIIPTIYQPGFNVLNNWLKLKLSKKTLKKFFDDNYIKDIAIYGMGELGKRLYEELIELDVNVLYGIDRNADVIEVDGLKIVTLNDKLDAVDAIIVTPIQFFDDIHESIDKKGNFNIVSLEDVVMYCL